MRSAQGPPACGRADPHLHRTEIQRPLPSPCLAADSPSAFQDVLYTLLVVLLGVTAFNERKTLL